MVASWDPQRRYASHSVLMDSNDASPQLPIRTHTVAIGTPSSGVPQSMDPQDNQLAQVLVSSVTNELLVVIHIHHRHIQLLTATARLLCHHVFRDSFSVGSLGMWASDMLSDSFGNHDWETTSDTTVRTQLQIDKTGIPTTESILELENET